MNKPHNRTFFRGGRPPALTRPAARSSVVARLASIPPPLGDMITLVFFGRRGSPLFVGHGADAVVQTQRRARTSDRPHPTTGRDASVPERSAEKISIEEKNPLAFPVDFHTINLVGLSELPSAPRRYLIRVGRLAEGQPGRAGRPVNE